MTSWQRRARLVAAAVAIGGIVGAYWMTGARRTPPPPPPVTELPPAVTARTTGGQAEQSSGARQDFSLTFKEQVTYSDNRTVASDLKVTVRQREGQTFLLAGREGTVGAGQSSVALNGDVVLTGHDGLVARSDTATYADGEGIVRAPGPVTFERGKTHGAGIGFTFDKRRDVLSILEQATAHVEGSAEGVMDVRAGAFTDARRDRFMQLQQDATIQRPGQTIAADELLVYLYPDRDEPDAMELRGHASITGSQGFGNLRAIKGGTVNIDYADDGRTVQHLTVAGQASLQLAGSTPKAPGQQLAAEWIDIAMGPDGAITNLVARERLLVTLPADGAAPARTIRAAELTGDGVAGAGLTAMRFTGGVDFREGGTAKTPDARTATSSTLTLALNPAGGADRATFTGDVAFTDGTLKAVANEARYFMIDDRLQLLGTAAASPRVTDTGLEVSATDIAIGLATNAVSAKGSVSSVMQPAASRNGSGAGKTPALLAGDQPLFAAAEALEYDSQARRATYTGKARLWQGATDIRAGTVALDEQKGDLSASGGVTSTLALATAKPAAGGPPARGTIARGQTMSYDDTARTATYTTSAQMSGPEGDLSADRIVLALAAAERSLERIEGTGTVVARVDQRDARGATLKYFANDGRYVMTGAPVTFTEECRVTTGRTLTFFGTAGKLIVDGNEAARTVSKGGGRCTPTPPPPPR
ncbi:MAG: LptA/OstA family protein [Vicinamibacterales bacterium]